MASPARVTLRCSAIAANTTSRFRSIARRSMAWILCTHGIDYLDGTPLPRLRVRTSPARHDFTLDLGLRSVALTCPTWRAAEDVLHPGLAPGRWRRATADALYLRGTGRRSPPAGAARRRRRCRRSAHVTLRARSAEALAAIARAAVRAGGTRAAAAPRRCDDPAGGIGLTLRDPHGRVLQVVHGDARHADAHERKDQPIAPGARGAEQPRRRRDAGASSSRRSASRSPTAPGSWPS